MTKLDKDRTSRGYCGWHKTWNGKNIYLRSKLEYIIALWLDYKKYEYATESFIYNNYKPDFFVYKNHNLIYIIEVKYSEKDRIEYLKKYKSYFQEQNIKYFVLSKKHINCIKKRYDFEFQVKNWIENSANILHNMCNEKNPHYGFKHSKETKKKIGEKSIERCKDKEFLKRFKKAIKKSMTEERRKKLSISAIKRFENIDERQKISLANSKYKKMLVEKRCKNCNNKFRIYECYIDGVFKFYMSVKNWNILKGDFCSSKCAISYIRKRQIKSKKQKQIKIYNKFLLEFGKIPLRRDFLKYCKKNNIPCDIRSTFGTHKNFLEEMNENN